MKGFIKFGKFMMRKVGLPLKHITTHERGHAGHQNGKFIKTCSVQAFRKDFIAKGIEGRKKNTE